MNKPFVPPTPMSMAAYFDKVTANTAKNLDKRNLHSMWMRVRSVVVQRKDASERMALYMEFIGRARHVGLKNGFLDLKQSSAKEQANILAEYIVQDRLGFNPGDTATNKAAGVLKDKVKDWAFSHLSQTGQRRADFLLKIKSLVEAKSPADAAKALMSMGDQVITNAVSDNIDTISKHAIRITPYGQTMAKFIKARYALYARLAKRAAPFLKRMNFILTVADIALSPTSTATDFEMEQHAFLYTLDEAIEELSKVANVQAMRNLDADTFFNSRILKLELNPCGPQLRTAR